MIVVDSSVWIDFLKGMATPHVSELIELTRSEHDVALNGPILTEVLRGFNSDSDADRISQHLHQFTILEPESTVEYSRAARLYRQARAKGITVSGLGDLLVASACISNQAWLLHNDRDFDLLATVSDLKIWQPPA